ncbi:hypothetical protein LAZ67_12003152 [Cordylochernes scorpioides]|uniref:Serpin domain-containing protein n=1 Tax=Cordylochernes scorpioides TaxID=51811 RepID=A0ABY6L295_9ARAC|nr:hypothetical protein LAZ67_12003152 [Cordylochernes scorpioides]
MDRRAPSQIMGSFTSQKVIDCQLGNHGFVYPWRYVTDRSAFNGDINYEPGPRDGVMLCSQTNPGSICNTHITSVVPHCHTDPSPGVMVWDVVGYTARSSLFRISGNLNSPRYNFEVLRPVAVPFRNSGGITSVFSNMMTVAAYVNKLTFYIYKELPDNRPNFVFSSYSLSHIFGIIYAGASDYTAAEIENVFGFDYNIHKDFREYSDRMVCADENYTLINDNVILIDKNYIILYPFRSILKVDYNISITPVSFKTNGCKLGCLINNWVKNKTNEMLEVFKEYCFDPESVIFISGILFFNSSWNKPFSKEIKGKFFNNGAECTPKFATMICIHENIDLYECDKYKVVRIPLEYNVLSLIIIIPNQKDGLAEIEDSIDASILQFIIQRFMKQDMKLCLPKFSVCSLNDYLKILPRIGVTTPFNCAAKFENISPNDRLKITSLVNVDKLDVNFKSASGSSYYAPDFSLKIARDKPKPRLLCVNHPFLFFIVDYWYDMIIFAGRIKEL